MPTAKSQISVAIIQTNNYWESPEANRSDLEEKISSIDGSYDLLVLPEMFTTGFSIKTKELAEPMNFTTHKWMKQMAKRYNTAICGSLIIKVGNDYFNRLLFVKPDGKTSHYDKKHLFGFGGEKELFTSGKERLIVELQGWKICPLICYDLRFPVFARNNHLEYDLLIYSASWPSARINVWDVLLKARAIENQTYVIGVNRIGQDGNKIAYSGHSQAVDPKGNLLTFLGETETTKIVNFSKEELDHFREKFPVHLDADDFKLL